MHGWEMPERSFSAERAAVIFIIALFAILASVLGLSLYQSYQAAILRINERVMTSSQIVATNAGWIDALAWQALRRIDDRLGPEVKAGATAGVENIKDAVYGLPGQVQAMSSIPMVSRFTPPTRSSSRSTSGTANISRRWPRARPNTYRRSWSAA